MANENLGDAKKAKNDEFYTQYDDINKEINAYLEYDKDVFRGKTVLLPCDDPEWSNFTKFFAQNFNRLGLKKLISTSYAIGSKPQDLNLQPTLFEIESPQFDKKKALQNGRIFVLDRDTNKDGVINFEDIIWSYLEGNGDFRSEEVTKLRDEADIVVTNPPFSLFREFWVWVIESKKKFLMLGNMNGVTYKEVFPLIMRNEAWTGTKPFGGGMDMIMPTESFKPSLAGSYAVNDSGVYIKNIMGVIWYTNLDHGRRHDPLQLMNIEDNLRFNKALEGMGYVEYDNYRAIEVPKIDAIPSDYEGLMGVPITFLSKYNPDQFEILGTSDNGLISDEHKRTPGLTAKFVEDYYEAGGKGAYKAGNPTAGLYLNGVATMIYKRLFIRHKKVG